MTSTNKQHEQTRGLVDMTIAMLICGTIGFTLLLTEQKLTDIIFFRCLFASLIIGSICWSRDLFSKTQFTRVFWVATMLSGIALLINWLLLFSSYRMIPIGIATTVYNIQPFMFVLICAILFKERLTRQVLFWLVVSFIGLCCISATQFNTEASYGHYLLGILQALLAALLYAIISVCAKYLKDYSPMLIIFFQLLLGVVAFFPLTDFSHLWHTVTIQSAAAIVTLGVLHTGIMYIMLYGAIQKLAAYQVASLSFLYPAIALLIDFLFLEVRLQGLQILGVFLVLLGAAGNNLQRIILYKIKS